MQRRIWVLSILLPLLILVGCRQTTTTTSNSMVTVALDTDAPSVGDATLLVTVSQNGEPVNDATVSVRGDMNHAGMVPVLPDAVSEGENGLYEIPFEFTMGGDWIITVDVLLPDGETTSITYEVDGVASNAEDDMDMDSEGDMDMDMSGVSGAYLTITNNNDDAVTLVAVSAEGVGMVEIHETTVDDNDMARMQELPDGITIEAGETVSLAPGGLHLMLMNLETDLVEGETIALTLEFDNESSMTFDAPIANMLPEDQSGSVESDGIVVTGFWARPTASAMPMSDDMTEEAESE
ncbi:MAG: copper chaperone PCu(A)C [Anaerolineae bacterium]